MDLPYNSQLDKPETRTLALKGDVSPQVLREGLNDEDPDVRLVAVLHPKLTPELMFEVLSGDDEWLKEQLLKRKDLPDTVIDAASSYPELKHILQERHDVSSDEKEELNKNIGFLLYPKMGEGRVYSEAYTGPVGTVKRRKALAGIKDQRVPEGAAISTFSKEKEAPPEKRKMMAVVDVHPPRDTGNKEEDKAEASKHLNAVVAHETQHVVFHRLKQKYGKNNAQKIVNSTLASIHPDLVNHIYSIYGAVHQNTPGFSPYANPEEAIVHLQNYLQDPRLRNSVHSRLQVKDPNAFVLKARKAWSGMRNAAQNMEPPQTNTSELVKAFLSKAIEAGGEYHPEDHLGHNTVLSQYIEAAKFLTGKEVPIETIRNFLWESDGDYKEAVFKAFEIYDEKDKKAFDSILEIKDLSKSEEAVMKGAKVIALSDTANEIAQEIQKTFNDGKVREVKLGGKHSSGSMISEDENGNTWLLKPGSGKNSPAKGVNEESASQSKREAAFSAVARAWGLGGYTPRTELLSIDGKEYAAIEMLPIFWQNLSRASKIDPNLSRRALEPYLRKGSVHQWAVLDYVLGNPDRHGNNMMVGPADEGNPLALIDHGSSWAGHSFDPGSDHNSFVPFYLRAWAPEKGFNGMDFEEKIKYIPMLSGQNELHLINWIMSLNPDTIANIAFKFGINPEASIDRLNKLKATVDQEGGSKALAELWLN